jgi:hypothetical protein
MRTSLPSNEVALNEYNDIAAMIFNTNETDKIVSVLIASGSTHSTNPNLKSGSREPKHW